MFADLCQSIEQFQEKHPSYNEAMQFIFIAPHGEIHQYFVPIEQWHSVVKPLMTSYVFVNDWKVQVQTVRF